MEEETRYTKQDLETMRAWTLQRKIQVTQTRLIEWLGRYDWNVYVSFSEPLLLSIPHPPSNKPSSSTPVNRLPVTDPQSPKSYF